MATGQTRAERQARRTEKRATLGRGTRGAEVWVVKRHSGRGSPKDEALWKQCFAGPEDKARAKYRKIRADVRQGGVRLIKPDGVIDSERHAPRLRTLW